jgi:hypothetical protein
VHTANRKHAANEFHSTDSRAAVRRCRPPKTLSRHYYTTVWELSTDRALDSPRTLSAQAPGIASPTCRDCGSNGPVRVQKGPCFARFCTQNRPPAYTTARFRPAFQPSQTATAHPAGTPRTTLPASSNPASAPVSSDESPPKPYLAGQNKITRPPVPAWRAARKRVPIRSRVPTRTHP